MGHKGTLCNPQETETLERPGQHVCLAARLPPTGPALCPWVTLVQLNSHCTFCSCTLQQEGRSKAATLG
jgi:hypothetical protein